jgi:ABC-type proline/glycine betaine transport system substrate-binding protein
VFLGNWMPTMAADVKPYLENKTVEDLGPNLTGAKYTLAVPQYLYDKGLKDFKDIAKFKAAVQSTATTSAKSAFKKGTKHQQREHIEK